MTSQPPGEPPAGPAGQQQPYPGQPYPGGPYTGGQYPPQQYPPQQYPQYSQPGYPPPTPSLPARPRGRTPLRLALIFGVLGIVLVVVGIVFIAKKSFSAVDGFSRVPVSVGTGTAHFSRAGNYVAYYEASNVTSSIRTVPLPVVALKSPSGRVIALNTLYGGKSRSSLHISHVLTYDYHGHRGVAIYQFTVPQAGNYQVVVRATGNELPGSDVAFGKSIGAGLAIGAATFVPGLLLVVVAVILLIVGLVQRRRSKRQQAAYAPAYGGYPQQ